MIMKVFETYESCIKMLNDIYAENSKKIDDLKLTVKDLIPDHIPEYKVINCALHACENELWSIEDCQYDIQRYESHYEEFIAYIEYAEKLIKLATGETT